MGDYNLDPTIVSIAPRHRYKYNHLRSQTVFGSVLMKPSKQDFSLSVRPGKQADTRAVFRVFYQSLSDLVLRLGQATHEEIEEQGRQEKWWENWQSLFEHLAQTADQFWIAM